MMNLKLYRIAPFGYLLFRHPIRYPIDVADSSTYVYGRHVRVIMGYGPNRIKTSREYLPSA